MQFPPSTLQGPVAEIYFSPLSALQPALDPIQHPESPSNSPRFIPPLDESTLLLSGLFNLEGNPFDPHLPEDELLSGGRSLGREIGIRCGNDVVWIREGRDRVFRGFGDERGRTLWWRGKGPREMDGDGIWTLLLVGASELDVKAIHKLLLFLRLKRLPIHTITTTDSQAPTIRIPPSTNRVLAHPPSRPSIPADDVPPPPPPHEHLGASRPSHTQTSPSEGPLKKTYRNSLVLVDPSTSSVISVLPLPPPKDPSRAAHFDPDLSYPDPSRSSNASSSSSTSDISPVSPEHYVPPPHLTPTQLQRGRELANEVEGISAGMFPNMRSVSNDEEENELERDGERQDALNGGQAAWQNGTQAHAHATTEAGGGMGNVLVKVEEASGTGGKVKTEETREKEIGKFRKGVEQEREGEEGAHERLSVMSFATVGSDFVRERTMGWETLSSVGVEDEEPSENRTMMQRIEEEMDSHDGPGSTTEPECSPDHGVLFKFLSSSSQITFIPLSSPNEVAERGLIPAAHLHSTEESSQEISEIGASTQWNWLDLLGLNFGGESWWRTWVGEKAMWFWETVVWTVAGGNATGAKLRSTSSPTKAIRSPPRRGNGETTARLSVLYFEDRPGLGLEAGRRVFIQP